MDSSSVGVAPRVRSEVGLLPDFMPSSKSQAEFSDVFANMQSQNKSANRRDDHSGQDRSERANSSSKSDYGQERARNAESKGAEREVESRQRSEGASDQSRHAVASDEVSPAEINDVPPATNSSDEAADKDESVVAADISEESEGSSELEDSVETAAMDPVFDGTEGDYLADADGQDLPISADVQQGGDVDGAELTTESEVGVSASVESVVDSDAAAVAGNINLAAEILRPGAEVAQASAAAKPLARSQAELAGLNPSQQVIEVEQLLNESQMGDKKMLTAGEIIVKNAMGLAGKGDMADLAPQGLGLKLGGGANLELIKTDVPLPAAVAAVVAKAQDHAVLASANKTGATAAPAVESSAAISSPMQSQYQAHSARAAGLPAGLQVPVGQPGWGQAVGDKVLMMAAKNLSVAEIQLDPPELGQLQVRVVLNHDQASVTFVSPQQSVREALDESVQRLRDMFEEEGVDLVNVDVSDQSQSGESEDGAESGLLAGEEDAASEAVVAEVDMSLVDHYV